jgi:hypothetical protein
MVINFQLNKWGWILFLLLNGLFSPFLLQADPHCINTINRAENLFFENLYGDALPLYAQLRSEIQDKELKEQLTMRLAACYLEQENPQTALTLLSPLKTGSYNNQTLFLTSLAHRQLGDFRHALDFLEQCSPAGSLETKSLIALEKGCHFMHLGDLINAQSVFKSIPLQKSHPLFFLLSPAAVK